MQTVSRIVCVGVGQGLLRVRGKGGIFLFYEDDSD